MNITPRCEVDIVFPRARVAVFVDGCFWHGCEQHARGYRQGSFWDDRILANLTRDVETTLALTEAGWTVIRVWEHEGIRASADRIESAVRGESG